MRKLFYVFVVLAFVSCNSGTKSNNPESVNDSAKMEVVEATINIGGMHCDMCVASVTKGVNELDGISTVQVNLDDSTAVVSFDASKLQLAKIEEAIEKRGYSIKKME